MLSPMFGFAGSEVLFDTRGAEVMEASAFTARWVKTRTEDFDDIAELCGGAGGTAALLVRRGYRQGPNFDI
eukprot:11968093-Prorocentrum_lima.AAC.1